MDGVSLSVIVIMNSRTGQHRQALRSEVLKMGTSKVKYTQTIYREGIVSRAMSKVNGENRQASSSRRRTVKDMRASDRPGERSRFVAHHCSHLNAK